ncbi:hypothetical protein Sta7437_3504 [Stanieria cyanosphaera PCC 7437]|uniref:Uncharacterized protein n=1 Tax=Stanieria cyanosphaera (strain ATCC 29371 / PCC 7437) TaxID=111780 RepID=K9XZB3_STAC7|nr:hypothetical protein [Stanieria cyanosphaera]AFZ37002.1 hypothetical protein Sta7437_3504 [Stanieria cyanosphaera PCC 7437]
MHKRFPFKTILTSLIGTSIASSFMALPVRANQDNLVNEAIATETIFNQNTYAYSNSPRYNEPSDNFKNLVGLTGLAIGTGVIGWHLVNAYKPSLVNSIPAINNNNSSLLDRISPKLRQELLRLVHNRQTANRLLSGTLISHPDRSPNWVAEKVIYDLKRDR